MKVVPVFPSFVARISDLDLNEETNREVFQELLWKYKVLVFEDQSLDEREFEKVGHLFGSIGFRTKLTGGGYFKGLEKVSDDSNVHSMFREESTYSEYPLIFGGDWHSDGSYDSYFSENKACYTMLYSKTVPEKGGDTHFMDLVDAANNLPDFVYDTIKEWNVVHRGGGRYGLKEAIQSKGTKSFASYYFKAIKHTDEEIAQLFKTNRTFKMLYRVDEDYIELTHPLLKEHPHTKEKALFVSSGFSYQVPDLHKPVSDKLLSMLIGHQEYSAAKYVLKWNPKMLVIWDNRLVNHKATESEGSRKMFRMFISDV